MVSNIDLFRNDLDAIVDNGQLYEYSMYRECMGEKEFDAQESLKSAKMVNGE